MRHPSTPHHPYPTHLQEVVPAPTLCPAGTYGLPLPTKPHEHPDKEDGMETDEEKIRPCEREWRGLGWCAGPSGVPCARGGGHVCSREGGMSPGWVTSPWWVAHHQGRSHVPQSVACPWDR